MVVILQRYVCHFFHYLYEIPTSQPQLERECPSLLTYASQAFPDLAAALPPIPKVKPANKRFMEMQNPADLRLSEVLELLRDYRRLATALQDLDAFEK